MIHHYLLVIHTRQSIASTTEALPLTNLRIRHTSLDHLLFVQCHCLYRLMCMKLLIFISFGLILILLLLICFYFSIICVAML